MGKALQGESCCGVPQIGAQVAAVNAGKPLQIDGSLSREPVDFPLPHRLRRDFQGACNRPAPPRFFDCFTNG